MPVGRRRLAVLGPLALALVAGLAWWGVGRRSVAVAVAAAVRGPAVEAVYATAGIEPVEWARVEPVVTGRIAAVAVREGQRVARGEVLARLEAEEQRAEVADLDAQLRYQRSEARRIDALASRGVVSSQIEDRAGRDLESVEARLDAARQRLEDRALRSPMDGIVLRRDAEVGEVAQPGEVLFWVGEAAPLWAVAEVDEQDIPLVRPGQRALMRVDAFPDRVFEGEVGEITPKGDPENKTYRVRVTVPDDAPLPIGMTVEVNIVVRHRDDAVLVPSGAVAEGRVFVVNDGAAHARAVEAGVTGEGMTEIRAGVAAGETVVIDPPADLVDGARVRPVSRGP